MAYHIGSMYCKSWNGWANITQQKTKDEKANFLALCASLLAKMWPMWEGN